LRLDGIAQLKDKQVQRSNCANCSKNCPRLGNFHAPITV